jgi:hypothetical protein
METVYTVNRAFLRDTRPNFFYFLLFYVFPRTETNVNYPGAGALIMALRGQFTDYGVAYGKRNTPLADEIYQEILTGTVGLITYAEGACGNNLARLEETGFKANKTTKTKEPLTGLVTDVHHMTLGSGKVKFEYTSDDYAHFFLGRFRLKGGTDADWVMMGRSENHTMIISVTLGVRADYEFQICGNGTQGAGEWSDIVIVFVL